jgi:hypothetical protein
MRPAKTAMSKITHPQAWLRRWREVKRRPVQGNSPNDRHLRGPDCHRPKRVCADSFSATPSPQPPGRQQVPGMRFLRQTESIGPMWHQTIKKLEPGAAFPTPNEEDRRPCQTIRSPIVFASRPSAPGPAKGRDGRCTPCSSSAMSSDRLFLDRVARQQSPSPLHRHQQITMHSSDGRSKGDVSTLHRGGHFYFALTTKPRRLARPGESAKLSPEGIA